MKKFLIGMILCLPTFLHAQNHSANAPLTELMATKDSVELRQKILNLERGGSDADYTLLHSFYLSKGNQHKADSISKVALKKYPTGMVAFQNAFADFAKEKDPALSDKEMKKMQKLFGTLPAYKDRQELSLAPLYVAQAYAGKASESKLSAYINAVPDSMHVVGYYSIGVTAGERGDLKTAEALTRIAVQQSEEKEAAKNKGTGKKSGEYYGIRESFAEILFKEKKYQEGLSFAREVYKESQRKSSAYANLYADYLVMTGDLKAAYPIMETSMRAGAASALTKENFKLAYTVQNGSEYGFQALSMAIDSAIQAKIMTKLTKTMVNTPAYGFVLKDIKGNTVSLAALKGKVVLLDFWATWCGPCKASFPAMQLAQEKYKNDPDVKFLFVHTMEENDPDPGKSAADYIHDQKLDFQVLVDPRDPKTHASAVATGFAINALPTKLIIDKQGNVRFRYSGGGVPQAMDAFLREVSAMIELARKG